jgi:peptide deformylase
MDQIKRKKKLESQMQEFQQEQQEQQQEDLRAYVTNREIDKVLKDMKDKLNMR